MKMIAQVIVSMPLWFKGLIMLVVALIIVPKVIPNVQWNGLPYYALFYCLFGTHFIFPTQLKKYHGAEHKVFSHKGLISRGRLKLIEKAAITNRNCSTNSVVVYFLSVIIMTVCFWLVFNEWNQSLMFASYTSVIVVPVVIRLMRIKAFLLVRKPILAISYWLQKYVTTTDPERIHLVASIQSYRKLAVKEFPDKLKVKRNPVQSEVRRMAIVDVTVIPIGTETASVSQYVADIHTILQSYKQEGKINFQLTPMNTIIEGELSILFEVIQAIHEAPFNQGINRVATNIRIDDRRDKIATMSSKLASVQTKLKEKE